MKITFFIVIGFVAVLVVAYFAIISRTDTFTGRWMAWKSSDVGDLYRFPNRPVRKAPPVFTFSQGETIAPGTVVNFHYRDRPQTEVLEDLLARTGTFAFIVIKDDEIRYESYFNGHERDSVVTSFSVAKSITSLFIGMALDDGYFDSLDDPITKYIPELLETDPRYEKITLGHLLSMKSGIAFKDTDIPWHDKSRAYYHPYLRDVVVNLPIAQEPGQSFAYNTFNPILLGIALERASGQLVPQYTEARLWQRLGMEYDASWSIDSEADNMAKMESGMNARAIDFAKIGRLILTRGVWEGEQVVSSEWIDQSTRVDPLNNIAKFGANYFYQNGWWVIGPAATDTYTVFGWGHLGQYLYIFPDEEMIVLRFGREIGKVDSWREIAREMVNLAKK
jgi:CubicO group peptidase (beta-lactamase class C family)